MGYAVQMDTFQHSVRYVEKAHIRPAGGPTWQVGIDFWAHPGSPSVKGTYEVDTMPRPGKLWLLPESLSLRAAAQEALARGVIGLLRPVKKVTATYGDGPLPLVLIETVRQVEAGARLQVSIQTRRAEMENYNIIARKAGRQDSFWLLGAHYDHLGRVGRTVFWGANDNASGVAFLLLLAEANTARHAAGWEWCLSDLGGRGGAIGGVLLCGAACGGATVPKRHAQL